MNVNMNKSINGDSYTNTNVITNTNINTNIVNNDRISNDCTDNMTTYGTRKIIKDFSIMASSMSVVRGWRNRRCIHIDYVLGCRADSDQAENVNITSLFLSSDELGSHPLRRLARSSAAAISSGFFSSSEMTSSSSG